MKSIMVVDDSQFVYEEMKTFLHDTEYEIKGYAQSGEESVELYGDLKPDLVTMDVILPEMDGMEAARKILEKWPDARILMVSSLAYEDTIDESKEIGAKKFIYKPFDKETLVGAIKECLE